MVFCPQHRIARHQIAEHDVLQGKLGHLLGRLDEIGNAAEHALHRVEINIPVTLHVKLSHHGTFTKHLGNGSRRHVERQADGVPLVFLERAHHMYIDQPLAECLQGGEVVEAVGLAELCRIAERDLHITHVFSLRSPVGIGKRHPITSKNNAGGKVVHIRSSHSDGLFSVGQ